MNNGDQDQYAQACQIDEWLARAASRLAGASPKLDAECLLSFYLNKSRTWLKTWPETQLSPQQCLELEHLLSRRDQGEPIAYITGQREFWDLTLKTSKATLIPRPDTETLVEQAIAFLVERQQQLSAGGESLSVIDLGTGTGAIALAIAKHLPHLKVFASDFKPEIVALAKQNARLNDIENVQFFCSDWYGQIDAHQVFDLIVSNPPYVEAGDAHLMQGDLRFEPRTALVADDDGLAAIKTIIAGGQQRLKPHGALMLEHGFEQGEVVRNLMQQHQFVNVKTVQDLAGLDRVTLGYRRERP